MKTTIGIGLAWWFGQHLGSPTPMFAVFTVLNVIQPTLAASLRHLGAQFVGITAGMLVAGLAYGVAHEASPLAVALAVSIGLVGTGLFRAEALLGSEIAASALLTVALGQGDWHWGFARIVESGWAGVLALLLNALVMPPNYLQDTREAAHRLADELVARLRVPLSDVSEHAPNEQTRRHLLEARAAVDQAKETRQQVTRAREALRFNFVQRYSPWRRSDAATLERYAAGAEALASAIVHTRTAARAAWQESRRKDQPTPHGVGWLQLEESVVEAIRAYEQAVLLGTEGAQSHAQEAIGAALTIQTQSVAVLTASPHMNHITVLAEVEHVLDDLAAALNARRR